MAISDTIQSMYENVGNVYDVLELAGADLTNVDKNIENLKQSWEERLLYFLANGTDVIWNNWLPKVDETGESITLNNTIQAKMDFVYKGNTSQESTANQLYLTSVNDDSGVWNIKHPTITNGIINVQGQNTEETENSSYKNGYFNVSNVNWKTNTTYYISCKIDIISNPRNVSSFVALAYGQGEGSTGATLMYNSQTQRYICSVTTGSTIINNRKNLEIRVASCELNISEISVKETADYTFDGYGPSPTPEHPSPVNVVTGDNEVKVEGKNLFDYKQIVKGSLDETTAEIVRADYVTINSLENNTITITTTAGYRGFTSPYIKIKPNTNYTFSIGATTLSRIILTFCYYDENKTFINSQRQYNINDKVINQNASYVRFSYEGDVVTNGTMSNIMLEQSSIKTEYEPYQSQTYPINLGVKNLIDLNHIQPNNSETFVSLIENGVRIKTQSGGYAGRIVINDLKQNTDYYLSYTWKDVSNGQNKVFVFAGTGTTTIAYKMNGNGFTFNTSTNTTINIWFYAQTNVAGEVEYTNIQLEEGTVKHSYTPSWFEPIELYKIGDYQDYIAKSAGKNLIDITKHTNTLASNTTILSPNSYQCESTGTWQGRVDLSFTNLKPNTDYTFSMNATQNQAIITNIVGIKDGVSTTLVQSTYVPYLPRTFNTSDYDTITMALNARGNGGSNGTIIVYNIELFEGSYTKTTIPNFEPYGKVWYKYGIIKKVVYDGSESWDVDGSGGYNNYKIYLSDALGGDTIITCLSQYFTGVTGNQSWSGTVDNSIGIGGSKTLRIRRTSFADVSIFKTWLSTHNTTVYYVLAIPTTTEITDTTLINQLEAIKLSYNEQTNISQTNTDKPFILDVTALKDLDAEDTTPTLTTNRGLLFTQSPVSENFINDEDDNSILEETINEEEPNIEDDNREEEEPVGFFEKEIINNDEEQEEIPTEPIEIDNGQR